MPVISCGACKKQMKVPDTVLGKAVKCPGCGQVVKTKAALPQPVGAAAAAPKPAAPKPASAPKSVAVAPKSAAPKPPPVPTGPIDVECSFCGDRFQAPPDEAGKTVKCRTCDADVIVPRTGSARTAAAPPPIPAEAPASAAPEADTVTPPGLPTLPAASSPPPPPPPAPPQSITFACSGCKNKIKVSATLAGKAVKCPKCAKAIKVPAPPTAPPPVATNGSAPAVWGPEWIEVNVAADGTAPPPVPTGGGVTGEWGEKLLEGKDIPEKTHADIKGTLSRGERILWADRPLVEILMDQARKMRFMTFLIGGIVGGLGLLAAVLLLIFGFLLAPILIIVFFGSICGLMMVFGAKAPAKTARTASLRSTYLLTNRRLIIHSGSATQYFFSGGQAAAVAGQDTITPFTGPELLRMRRIENKKHEGAGDLLFGRDTFEKPIGNGLRGIEKVKEVEKLLREKLINPLIDKLLRGEKVGGEEQAKLKKEKEEADKDDNIKDAPGVVSARGAPIDDDNIKDAPGHGKNKGAAIGDDNLKDAPGTAFEAELSKVPADQKDQVDAELTAGEKVLWIGEPEASVKGRSFLGAMTGGAKRKEPPYTLYAITNRRVLVWDGDDDGPTNYYSPHLYQLSLEEDKRVKSGGNILFKVVKYTVTTTSRDKRTGRTSSSTSTEYHYFGMLHIRNYRRVARLLFETLLKPLAD